jgi:hypothetical protein
MPSALASISTRSSASAGTWNVNVNVSARPTGSDSMNHDPSLLIVVFVIEIVMKRISEKTYASVLVRIHLNVLNV